MQAPLPSLHLLERCVPSARRALFTSISCGAISDFSELLQPVWHRLFRLLAALLARAPDALVRADARSPAVLAPAPLALVRADARPPELLALAPDAMVRTDARLPALLACAFDALVRAEARSPAVLALAPLALVLADAKEAPTGFSFAQSAPTRNQLEPLNMEGKSLVGSQIMYKWPREGWCQGEIVQWNDNPKCKNKTKTAGTCEPFT